MRLKLSFQGEVEERDEWVRERFISFLKKAFQSASEERYKNLFSAKKVRPYVYAPFFGSEFEKSRIGPDLSFIFSSGDYEIISTFWNGIIILKERRSDYIEINGKKFILKNINLLPNKRITSKRVIFKTIGTSILTDPSSAPDDFKNWFIIPEKENLERFNSVLCERVRQKYEIIKSRKIEPDLRFNLLADYPIKETVIPLFKGYVRGFRGYFLLEGSPEILNFLYDYGFGVRTGQGFGLLDVIKQL